MAVEDRLGFKFRSSRNPRSNVDVHVRNNICCNVIPLLRIKSLSFIQLDEQICRIGLSGVLKSHFSSISDRHLVAQQPRIRV
jgi:hypothetical protein